MWVTETILVICCLVVMATAVQEENILRWRPDHHCGGYYMVTLPSGEMITAECNPHEGNPCCSSHNWCGESWSHCHCSLCSDYRDIWRQRNPEPPVVPVRCPSPYEEVSDKCLLYSNEALTWSSAEEFCKEQEGRLITFQSLDQMMALVTNLTQLKISEDSSADLDTPYWVDLSTLSHIDPENQMLEWRWDTEERSPEQNISAEGVPSSDDPKLCQFMTHASSSIFHNGDCSELKLPLCERDFQ